MGPPPRKNTVTFKYDENQDFYLCKKCATHITRQNQLLRKYDGPENNKRYLLFEHLINVVLDIDYEISNTITTVRSTYCTKCSADFGFKFIKLETPKDEIQIGRFIVFAEKFQVWKGKKLLDAVTEQPAENFLGEVIAESGSIDFPDGGSEEPVDDEMIAELTKEVQEKTLELLRITEQLKLLGVTEFPS